MADVLTQAQRRLNMSRVRGKNTRPELILRKGLHARGLRFRIHRKDIPGRPDLAFISARAVVFVHGCFWHGHRCPLFKVPETRTEFWMNKILANMHRDEIVARQLQAEGWRSLVVWECALRGRGRLPLQTVLDLTETFVRGDQLTARIAGDFSPRDTSTP
ncbi:very short patch repair endonuclease [Tistrella mobilis]|uniref:very short patch repair endonuclease n=1 Tax=Tistrella mobilis TaxID=171437 RepID=UPI0035569CFF